MINVAAKRVHRPAPAIFTAIVLTLAVAAALTIKLLALPQLPALVPWGSTPVIAAPLLLRRRRSSVLSGCGPFSAAGPFRSSQRRPVDLPGRGPRQLGHVVDGSRVGVRAHPRPAPFLQLAVQVAGCLRAGREPDEGGDHLAPHRIRQA